jgi:hypothetical protein
VDETPNDSDVQYQVVATRRQQWDNLVWQVPVVSLTGQAFLLTIALSGGNSEFARLISSGLACLASLLSMTLMARHRAAEILDAEWLAGYEERRGWDVVHGKAWAEKRHTLNVAGWFSKVRGFQSWMFGFSVFALSAATTFVVVLATHNRVLN